jgi:hypothetical protein
MYKIFSSAFFSSRGNVPKETSPNSPGAASLPLKVDNALEVGEINENSDQNSLVFVAGTSQVRESLIANPTHQSKNLLLIKYKIANCWWEDNRERDKRQESHHHREK